eukprot:g18758.t1
MRPEPVQFAKEPVQQNEEATVIGAKMMDAVDIQEVKEATPDEVASPVDQTDLPLRTVALSVLFYAACWSTLLLINKVAMHFVPDASFILFCQFLSSSLTVRVIKCTTPDADIELLRFDKVRIFFVACLIFFLCFLANTAAMKSVNEETMIVARSCAPIAVCILEHFALGRSLPSFQGTMALLAIPGGAVLYVVSGEGFKIEGGTWLLAYFAFIVTEIVFVKFVLDTVPVSTWTCVYYYNTLQLGTPSGSRQEL